MPADSYMHPFPPRIQKNKNTGYVQHAYHQPQTDVFLEEISTVTALGTNRKKKRTNQQFCTT